MSALLAAEQVARAADLEVAQGDVEAGAEAGVLLERVEPLSSL